MMVQVLDADYTMLNDRPVIRIFGKSENGKSYCVFVNNFYPYFYLKTDDFERTVEILNNKFNGEVRGVEQVEKFLPFGYQRNKIPVLKIILKNPAKTPEIRDSLSGEPFEADILFKYRFFADKGIKGMNWIDVKGKFIKTDTVYCNSIDAEEVLTKEKEENAPLRILSIDIETETPNDRIPEPEKDSIIMISLAFSSEYKGMKSMVLVSKRVSVNEKWIIQLDNEEKMLEMLRDIIIDYDPDVITGYNIQNFDIPFIIGRMGKLGIKRDLGRVKDKPVFVRKMGSRSVTYITGRIIFDSYQAIRKDFSFKTYTLNNVSEKLLGKKKIDVKYKEFEKLWNGNKEGMKRLLDYSRRDAELALELVEKKNLMDKYIALSKVSGVLLQDVLDGGESVRIEHMLLSEFNKRDVLFPMKPNEKLVSERIKERNKYGLKGGFVLEPKKGLHTGNCIVVLDFKSLYPSIIMTYNICPTTILKDDSINEYDESPVGVKFVKKEVREGIVPSVLEKLINQRTEVKKKMYQEKDPDSKRLLYAKQLALKIMANAFYGQLGYPKSRLYVIEVANSVTAFGRSIIQNTMKEIESKGFEIIYGDTDSVFVKVGTDDLDKAWEIGEKITKEIKLPGKLILELEKVFRSFLIQTKKRYAGWAFEKNNGEWEDKIETKGIETVRRDWPDLTTETVHEVLKIILKEGDVKKAIKFVRGVVEKLSRGEIDLEKLAVTKSITKNIDKYDGMLPHIELAKKMRERNPATAPTPGERISFVIIRGNQMLSKRAESPDYIREHNLKIDSDYYINNLLLPPLERIFSVIGVDKGELLGMGRQYNLKELLTNSIDKRDYKIKLSPNEAKIKNLRGFVCSKCNKSFRRVPLSGRCECGGEILALGDGSVGGMVEVMA
ncbi:MAG: DNA polymerase elongation subunit [Candidatus Aenigmarchaeota archaeon]|nr:DNA polymerase elongation subunit [Candidatus Aenigmarchaeota archaeon]